MLRKAFAGLLSALLLAPALPAEAQVREPELVAGIALVQEGDFEAALATLEGAVRRLEAGPRPSPELALGYVYVGMTYLELDQEPSARTRFRQAAREDPALRLDPRDFSAQVIRFFDAARQEVDPARSVPAAAPRPAPSPTPEPKKKKRSAVPFILLGGAAAAGGVALLAGGSSGSAATTTTTPPVGATTTTTPGATTTTTTTTATTTTTTTPPPPPATCAYSMTPATQTVPAAGANGTCSVRATPSSCAWTAESSDAWLSITSGSGTGNGTVTFHAAANVDNQRKARIRLLQNGDARCEIVQDSGRPVAPPTQGLVWSSELDAPGSSGQIVVDGRETIYQAMGRAQRSAAAREKQVRIEATLVRASGRSGVWRFTFGGAFAPGSLRVTAGDVVTITADTVTFRLAGKPGERVVFGLELAGP